MTMTPVTPTQATLPPGAISASLSVGGLSKQFVAHLRGGRRWTVLDGVDLEVDPGTCVAITGASGAGKSSLLRCVYRSYRPDGGTIRLRAGDLDVDLAAADERTVLAARREAVALVTQFLHVIPRVPAVDLVAAAGIGRDEAAERLRALGLGDEQIGAPPATFSGGERQMVGLAMALAQPKPLVLLDEPTASLDPGRRERALAAVVERKVAGATLLAVFHDVPATPGLVDRVLILRNGRLEAA